MWRQAFSRRDALRVGSLTAAATALPLSAIAAEAIADEAGDGGAKIPPTCDSVILLNMMGGVTHHESFDPKPDAPEDVRGSLKTIATSLPGVQFSEACPNLARIAHKLAVVRSYS